MWKDASESVQEKRRVGPAESDATMQRYPPPFQFVLTRRPGNDAGRFRKKDEGSLHAKYQKAHSQ